MYRRSFLKSMGISGMMMATGAIPVELFRDPDFMTLTVLHTNDVHSRIDPFPMDGSSRQGLGGVARRAALIDKIRKENEHVLLLDAGDIFQGTPYFNFFGGELEFKLMSEMKYDASTIGNHDFDGGIDGLLKQMPHASFPFIISNYDFSNTVLHQKTLPYKVFEKGDVKIGVLGVGIELKGLVPKALYKETVYMDPIKHANETARILKRDLKCDFVICLSHLGYNYRSEEVCDVILANHSRNIDMIIGGHTHTFLNYPDLRRNLEGEPIIITQVGWAGMKLGRIDVHFEKNTKNNCTSCKNLWVKN